MDCNYTDDDVKRYITKHMTADEENIANLPAYMDYFYNHVPSNCWGSEAVLKDWLAGRE